MFNLSLNMLNQGVEHATLIIFSATLNGLQQIPPWEIEVEIISKGLTEYIIGNCSAKSRRHSGQK